MEPGSCSQQHLVLSTACQHISQVWIFPGEPAILFQLFSSNWFTGILRSLKLNSFSSQYPGAGDWISGTSLLPGWRDGLLHQYGCTCSLVLMPTLTKHILCNMESIIKSLDIQRDVVKGNKREGKKAHSL
ncbi:unnamed protein product [Rangifer tarandus platyrhynchus]|uniref:Uncharacterized protein n=2 Tax=Rangifer tarandus platyrhynchus TaxID=3082113 RepID=A0AC60A178_RANTA|nr:unnamed protein product [Rangifer tarandus platyrhynchus]